MAVFLPAPARAQGIGLDTAPFCQLLLHSTPPVFIDLDGDGNPDVRPTRIHDVTLCGDTWAWAVLFPPQVELCGAGWHPTCVAVRVTLMPVEGQAGASAELCWSADGARTCHGLSTTDLSWPPRVTACIGVDAGGGHPCDGTVFTLE